MAIRLGFWRLHGDDFDLDERIFGQAGNFDGGAGGRGDAFGRKVLPVNGIHGDEVIHVLDEDCGLDDVDEVDAGFIQDGLDVLHDLSSLFGYAARNEIACLWINRNLA